MRDPSLQDKFEMPLIERDQEVQAPATQASAEAFANGVGLRRAHWYSQHSHYGRELTVQFPGENAVPVMNQESIRMTTRERLPELLGGPFRRRVGGHVVMEDST